MNLAETKLAVIGLGYVGLPLAVEFGKQFPTVGFDIKESRVAELQAGHDRTLEVEPEELVPVVGGVEQSVLEHLAVAAEQFARGEGGDEGGYDEGVERLRVGADGVLDTGVVEARLAA